MIYKLDIGKKFDGNLFSGNIISDPAGKIRNFARQPHPICNYMFADSASFLSTSTCYPSPCPVKLTNRIKIKDDTGQASLQGYGSKEKSI